MPKDEIVKAIQGREPVDNLWREYLRNIPGERPNAGQFERWLSAEVVRLRARVAELEAAGARPPEPFQIIRSQNDVSEIINEISMVLAGDAVCFEGECIAELANAIFQWLKNETAERPLNIKKIKDEPKIAAGASGAEAEQ